MLGKLKNAVKAIHDWARPYCETCLQHAFRHHHCSLCSKIAATNRVDDLRTNLSKHKVCDQDASNALWVCDECFAVRERAKCCKTGHVFFAREDRMDDFDGSKLQNNLSPYHPDSQLQGALSPEGYLLVEVEHEALQERIAN